MRQWKRKCRRRSSLGCREDQILHPKGTTNTECSLFAVRFAAAQSPLPRRRVRQNAVTVSKSHGPCPQCFAQRCRRVIVSLSHCLIVPARNASRSDAGGSPSPRLPVSQSPSLQVSKSHGLMVSWSHGLMVSWSHCPCPQGFAQRCRRVPVSSSQSLKVSRRSRPPLSAASGTCCRSSGLRGWNTKVRAILRHHAPAPNL